MARQLQYSGTSGTDLTDQLRAFISPAKDSGFSGIHVGGRTSHRVHQRSRGQSLHEASEDTGRQRSTICSRGRPEDLGTPGSDKRNGGRLPYLDMGGSMCDHSDGLKPYIRAIPCPSQLEPFPRHDPGEQPDKASGARHTKRKRTGGPLRLG